MLIHPMGITSFGFPRLLEKSLRTLPAPVLGGGSRAVVPPKPPRGRGFEHFPRDLFPRPRAFGLHAFGGGIWTAVTFVGISEISYGGNDVLCA
jgi:hypothetical protein